MYNAHQIDDMESMYLNRTHILEVFKRYSDLKIRELKCQNSSSIRVPLLFSNMALLTLLFTKTIAIKEMI